MFPYDGPVVNNTPGSIVGYKYFNMSLLDKAAPTSTTDAGNGYIYLGGTSGTTSVKTFTGK